MKNCTINCSPRQVALSSIAAFAFLFLYDWLVHGVLLKDMYEATAALWRPMEDMQRMMPICIGYHMFLGIILASMFAKYRNYENASYEVATDGENKKCQISRGMCFGIHIGLVLGLVQAMLYVSVPVPAIMAAAWFAAGLLQGIGVGLVLSMFYRRNKEVA